MANETEIKLRIEDVPAFRRVLKRIGARPAVPATPRVFESNVLFDTPDRLLSKNGQILRIRTETPARPLHRKHRVDHSPAILTFKRPLQSAKKPAEPAHGSHKIREEVELRISNGGALKKIFEALHIGPWFKYEKYRTTYRLPGAKRWAKGLLIELDETPIGVFTELEGPGGAIDRAAKELGFSPADYIIASYLELYLQECRAKEIVPSHMVFPGKNPHAGALR